MPFRQRDKNNFKFNASQAGQLRRYDKVKKHNGNRRLLGYLYANRDRDIYQRDVEKEFSIRRATSSKVITRLEGKGFVRRESVDCDARLKKLVLTEEGIKIQRDVCRELDDFDEKLISVLTKDEQETLFELLGKIKNSLEKE